MYVTVTTKKLLGALGAVVALVVLVARAAVLGAASAVAGARVRALGGGEVDEREEDKRLHGVG